ncbi:hypothetical protein [Paraburkholderia pallida]|uniref:Uncharacterized protein n=1 Tax=Paraburkholderia pallida TaxID=2547399 RepID=A0A4P7CZV9_9BURK|nr:hypothetical protein [Paraburkholderia pallida]QBR01921.1 hypothetical protein E1956_32825 [Paraburkholderia pallida]
MNLEDIQPALTGDTSIPDFGSALSAYAEPLRTHSAWKWNCVPRLLILAVCMWSLALAWIELNIASPDSTAMCAVVVAKAIWVGAGILAILAKRYWRGIFAFLCCASVLAVGPALPSALAISKPIFMVLLTECVLKTLCLISLLSRRFARQARN